MADPAPAAAPTPMSVIRSRRFLVLLVLAAIVGVIVSLVAWGFLELVYQTQQEAFTHLPHALGYDSAPKWWYLVVLAVAGLLVALAIKYLPGTGGHIPAEGLNPSPTMPAEIPGVFFAGLAAIGLGTVIGPEAPLLALGGALGILIIRMLRKDAPAELGELMAAAGAFAGLSFLFGSPIIAAILLIEATQLGGPRLPLVLVPGLLAAGIGTLVSIGMGSWTGLNTSDISLVPVHLPQFARPDVADFGWTILLAAAIAIVTVVIFRGAREVVRLVTPRPFILLPLVGLAVAGLAIAFNETSGKSVNEVLFSGQDQLSGLVASYGGWSVGTLGLLVAFKGIAYSLSLGSFRGGPTFPAIFLGAAAGLMAAHLPGYGLTPAVAVGIGAGTVAVLRLPLSAVVLALVLTLQSGLGSGPLIVVGVVVAYLTTIWISPEPEAEGADPDAGPSADPTLAAGSV